MVATNLECLVGYRTLRDEVQARVKAYGCVFGRVFQASICICIATYGVSMPSLPTYTESIPTLTGTMHTL